MHVHVLVLTELVTALLLWATVGNTKVNQLPPKAVLNSQVNLVVR